MSFKKIDGKLPEYKPSQRVWNMMVRQHIVDATEEPQHVLERIVRTLFAVEENFNTSPDEIASLQYEFASYMVKNLVMPGTPTLTNAGRNLSSALSSCVVIPVDLRKKQSAASLIKEYYKQNMGSGFDFTPYDDPVGLLKWINELSARETLANSYDRYIGNMGSLHVSHPKIEEFIEAKSVDGVIPHFNISIDASESFMQAATAGDMFTLQNGKRVHAAKLLRKMAESAWRTGDPGILFIERMNMSNPLADTEDGRYVSTPPCAEMGLAFGEVCQFGYINVAGFVKKGKIDYKELEKVTLLTTRVLDNAVEYSMKFYPSAKTRKITAWKRKIGIGVCGLADMLIACGIPYTSSQAVQFARDVLSFINYVSKVQSVALAQKRGSCLAMDDKQHNAYYTEKFLEKKYAKNATNSVSAKQWQDLSEYIANTGLLRNILTTSLPPTGRASIILGVTSSIEPIFTIYDEEKKIKKVIKRYIRSIDPIHSKQILFEVERSGNFQTIRELPSSSSEVLRTAKEISPESHIEMVNAVAGNQGVIDEGASKTINLSSEISIEAIEKIFLHAYTKGLKNVSVYRDTSKIGQPKLL